MRVHIIVNKYAGKGNGEQMMDEIKTMLTGVNISSSFTERTPDALIKYIKENQDITHLIAIGGDGTMNQCAQALAWSNIILIPVPAGTGTDFVRTVGKLSPEIIMDVIKNDNFRYCDLGKITSDIFSGFFINVMEAGMGGAVMKRVNSTGARSGLTISSSILKEVLRGNKYRLIMKSEERDYSGNIMDVVIANGQYYGQGIHISPESILDDGFLDVHIIKYMPRLKTLSKLRTLKNGTYIRDENVVNLKIREVSIDSDGPVEIDGESFGPGKMKIRVCHNALKIFSQDFKP